MPNNVLNYAEVWQKDLLQIFNQNALCSPFITDKVKWLNAKSFHFTQMGLSGYKAHSRDGGWNRGKVNQTDNVYTLAHDRDIEFLIDRADVDETNATASIQNVSYVFTRTQSVPEIDAQFFSAVAQKATTAGLSSETAKTAWTTTNVFGKLKAILLKGRLRQYKQGSSLVMYVSSEIMDLLEAAKDFTRKIDVTNIADGGAGIETRVTTIDNNVPLIEVIDTDRFYTEFDFADGFKPASGSKQINVLVASTESVKAVTKIASIYFFEPGAHTEGDGYLYQNRCLSDTVVFPNGLNNEIDCIFVDHDSTAVA